MSVVDFRRRPSAYPFIHAEPDLRIRRGPEALDDRWHADLCAMLAVMVEVVENLTPGDKRILEAVRRAGSVRQAAKDLAPDRPSYRAYVQRRVKMFRLRLKQAMSNSAGSQVAGASRESSS